MLFFNVLTGYNRQKSVDIFREYVQSMKEHIQKHFSQCMYHIHVYDTCTPMR